MFNDELYEPNSHKMTIPQEKSQCVSCFIETKSETLYTVERGSSNCLAAVRMDFIAER